MYNVGQADNLLSAGRVAYPKYENGSLTEKEYSCPRLEPDVKKRPVSIPLGSYQDPYDEYGYTNSVEPYVDNTQQKRAGEISDGMILIVMIALLVILSICTYISFQDKM